jgi:hypothetical protein
VDIGELGIFCRDFNIVLPKTKINEVFNRVSESRKSLDLDQFKQVLPHLGLEYAKAKTVEIQCRLREMKHIMEYPKNKNEVKIAKNLYELMKKHYLYMERK